MTAELYICLRFEHVVFRLVTQLVGVLIFGGRIASPVCVMLSVGPIPSDPVGRLVD